MIALSPTDTDWFHFLRKQSDVPMVNFGLLLIGILRTLTLEIIGTLF